MRPKKNYFITPKNIFTTPSMKCYYKTYYYL